MTPGAWIALTAAGWYGGWSATSFAAYALDKVAAARGWRRVRERRLHEIDFLGGWPGGWLAQRVLRHKLRKRAFMRVFWLAPALHVLLWGAAGLLLTRWQPDARREPPAGEHAVDRNGVDGSVVSD